MSVNKVILLGNVGRDPDVRYVSQGHPVATFSLATTERAFTNSNGVQVPERTEWHNIVMWGRNAEVAEKYIRKGTQLYLEGRLRTRMWEDRNTIKHYVTEVHVDTFELLGRPKSDTQQPAAPTSQAAPQAEQSQAAPYQPAQQQQQVTPQSPVDPNKPPF